MKTKEEVKEAFTLIFNLQKELDKGFPVTLKVGKKKLEMMAQTCLGDTDKDCISIDYDIELLPNCDLSKWLFDSVDDSTNVIYDWLDHSALLNKARKLFKKQLEVVDKAWEGSVPIDMFWNTYKKDSKLDAHFKRFYADWSAITKKEQREKELKENGVQIEGIWFTKDELRKIVANFDKN